MLKFSQNFGKCCWHFRVNVFGRGGIQKPLKIWYCDEWEVKLYTKIYSASPNYTENYVISVLKDMI
jgi:hypothetical protein